MAGDCQWAWSDYDAWEQGMRAWADLAAQLKKPFLDARKR